MDSIRTNYCADCKVKVDRIAALEAENARLRELGDRLINALELEGVEKEYPKTIKAWREVTAC